MNLHPEHQNTKTRTKDKVHWIGGNTVLDLVFHQYHVPTYKDTKKLCVGASHLDVNSNVINSNLSFTADEPHPIPNEKKSESLVGVQYLKQNKTKQKR